jgi:DNA-binding MarR family transcriptional regulator
MSITVRFGAQAIGQTEKALNAILERQLRGTGLTEPQWIALVLTASAAAAGSIDADQLTVRLAGALKVSEATARARIDELINQGIVRTPSGAGSELELTDEGERLYSQIRAAVTQITDRLWGDLPSEDLATAAQVLSTVLTRANAELAAA